MAVNMSLFPNDSTPTSGAELSVCQSYRYLLWRELDQPTSSRSTVVFVMFNPSTADGCTDDPTVRRCASFARGWGYRKLVVVNLFAYRSSVPADLAKVSDPVGPYNNRRIRQAVSSVGSVVYAWGAFKPSASIRNRVMVVDAIVRNAGHCPLCLGLTKSGHPRHPLYVKSNTRLVQA